jgi:hypothetical protein
VSVQTAIVFIYMQCKMVVIMCVLVHVLTEHSRDFKSVAFLQNCVDVRGSCTETCATLSGNGNQFLFVNIHEVADIKAEEDPEPTASPLVNNEPAVSCVCVCVYRVLFTSHVSLSVHPST